MSEVALERKHLRTVYAFRVVAARAAAQLAQRFDASLEAGPFAAQQRQHDAASHSVVLVKCVMAAQLPRLFSNRRAVVNPALLQQVQHLIEHRIREHVAIDALRDVEEDLANREAPFECFGPRAQRENR